MPDNHDHLDGGQDLDPREDATPREDAADDTGQDTHRLSTDGGAEPTTRIDAASLPGDPAAAETERTDVSGDEATRPTFPAPGGNQPGEDSTERTQAITPVPAESDAETTQRIGAVSGATWTQGSLSAPQEQPQAAGQPAERKRSYAKAGIIGGVAAGVLVLAYVLDMALSSGTVPRGTMVADVAIGGMDHAAAESTLRKEIGPELGEPVVLRAGDAQTTIDPEPAGLTMDWQATLDHVGSQPWNPITRVSSFFTTTQVAPVTNGDRSQVTAALEQATDELNREPREGTVRFEGATPIAVNPSNGRTVDVAAATDAVIADWGGGDPVDVPFSEQPVSTTQEGVARAVAEVAEPAVSAPVTVRGEGTDATLQPEDIAASLRFEPDGNGGLKASVDNESVVEAVEPQLRDTIRPGKNAEITVQGGAPTVVPSVNGRGIEWDKSLDSLLDVYKQPGDRSVQAQYRDEPAQFTTEQANGLGIKEVVSEFQTGGFEQASGVNIRRTAEQVNGAIIKPGETFSLNGHTGPRGTAQGYVESGIIQDGRPQKAVGGGISQFATTLYNASYFAGMQDVEHKEHSYYIDRYPEGREATVFQSPSGKSIIDVKFKNTSENGVMITTEWTPSSITVKFWSTKTYDVSSETGPRTNPTPPERTVVPPGEPCSPSTGEPGFTVTDTRTIKNVNTGNVNRESPTKTVYDPHPIVDCPPPPPAGAPPPPG
ncbi:VanW family protein [Allosaccharopolyspora coralli]|nr:VanW family protein [Allosaccharopolyspora coralli]